MEIVVIIMAAIVMAIYLFISNRNYIKKTIRNSWAKFPEEKIFGSLDEKILVESMEILSKYYPGKYKIDSYTWKDLDFIKIYNLINKGYTSMGEDYLYTQLRNFGQEPYSIEEFQSLKDYFFENEIDRKKLEYILYKIGRNRNFSLPYFIDSKKNKFNNEDKIIFFLGMIPFLLLIAILLTFPIKQKISIILMGIFFASMILNIIYYEYKAKRMKVDIMNSCYLASFVKSSRKFKKFKLVNQEKIENYLEKVGSISFWINFRYKESNDPFEILLQEIKKIFLLPLVSHQVILKIIEKNYSQLLGLYIEIGKIESAISTLNFELAIGNTSKASFIEEKKIEAEEIYHPLVKNSVTNEVNFDKVNIITGSNASGKSTYVKSIAVNAILAQSLNLVCAKGFKMKKGGIFSSMAIKDDVVSGDSYFIAEIKSLKRIVDDSFINDSYYFIDEILKGTNTIERIAASSSIIRHLIDRNSLAMIASHDIELTTKFGEEIRNIHFREKVMEDGKIIFDYKLRLGPSKTRNAIRLLESMDFPKEIVERANRQAEDLTIKKEIKNL